MAEQQNPDGPTETTLTIQRLGHRGDGVAEGPNGPVYVRRALPGEVVEGMMANSRMAAPRIVSPSPNRVTPPCRHARSCGGCSVQHLRDEAAAGWKAEIVVRALSAQGLDAPMRPVLTSPPASRRRATLSARRTKGGVTLGFHAAGSGQIVDTPDCLLLRPALMALRPVLTRIVQVSASRKSELSLSVTETETGADIAASGGGALDLARRTALVACVGGPVARITWEGEVLAQAVRPSIRVDGIVVPLPPGAFLQATEEGERALRGAVSEALATPTRVVDLFAGCGTFALPLARRMPVHAVEGDDALTEACASGWRGAEGLRAVTGETRDLFRRPLRPEELASFDAAVIDPPRAGAEAQTRALAAAPSITRIAAVSCNPVTFARDAQLLRAGGFVLDWVQVVDQFRWSPHVELAAAFRRVHMPG